MHLQYKDGKQVKFYYDFEHDQFLPDQDGKPLSAAKEQEVRNAPEFRRAMEQARRRLNVPGENQ